MKSVFAQVYKRVEPKHGFLTPLQMIEKMIEASMSWDMSDKEPYMRFLIRIHGGSGDNAVVSEVMALQSIARSDIGWDLRGVLKNKVGYPYDNRYLYDGYDGIEIVGRISHEDESWQDWLS